MINNLQLQPALYKSVQLGISAGMKSHNDFDTNDEIDSLMQVTSRGNAPKGLIEKTFQNYCWMNEQLTLVEQLISIHICVRMKLWGGVRCFYFIFWA